MRTRDARRIRMAIMGGRWSANQKVRAEMFPFMNDAYQRSWKKRAVKLGLIYFCSTRGGERYTTNAPEGEVVKVTKHYATITYPASDVYWQKALKDPRYHRRHVCRVEEPTSEDWALYYQAKAGLRALEAYEGTEWGGPDYGTEVKKPQPRVTYEYQETNAEWLARCQELDAEE